MDTVRAAKFPFLTEAKEFVANQHIEMADLITSEDLLPARKRGLQRVLEALEKGTVEYRPLMNDYDRLMEVMSYPYARMLVSQINDRYLTKRYALGEAVRMNQNLNDEKRNMTTLMTVSGELGVEAVGNETGVVRMKFTDFLMLAGRLKSKEWKLINNDVRDGMVYLQAERFNRLVQNAFQDKIESEIPLMIPDEFVPYVTKDVEHVKAKLVSTKAAMSPTGGKDLDVKFLPPCIKQLVQMSNQGLNLPHSGRFALVSFFNTMGLDYNGIIRIFSESPDFDESKSEYQIRHITGDLTGREGYTPPECKTMKTNGLCYNPDKLCESEKVNHPLNYYRIRMWIDEKEKQKAEGGGPPEGQPEGQ